VARTIQKNLIAELALILSYSNQKYLLLVPGLPLPIRVTTV
jgi:hypothetical protein